jgi:WD40 repeat protein/serine/threonine protein kinase
MITSSRVPLAASGNDSSILEIVDELVRRHQAGEAIDLEELAGGDPARVEQLRQFLPTLEKLADLGLSVTSRSPASPPAPDDPGPGAGTLGDYRIVREVGRGGMGVVYEAVQVSLNRRVALKVLPFAAVADERQLRRFRVEAQAAALLHHTHIVPVHAVGCERGVHYYAMQFIEGQTLARVIDELRELEAPRAEAPLDSAGAAFALASDLASGTLGATEAGPDDARSTGPPSPAVGAPAPPRTPAGSSGSTTRGRAFFRNAARLGIQAAEALEHAHQQGVLHRDVKPSNLLVDPRGELWVTDFGLARLQGEAGLTMTGDILGTLRYMSPEQALGRPAAIDHCTDVYSLGATLYELLTLHPVFEDEDRGALLRQIAFGEPRPLRKLNAAVPRELETNVLKALEKEPGSRYATAQELAEDVRRYMEDRPIKAKRPSLSERAAKWARRHTAVVWSAVALLVLAVIALSAGIVLVNQERRQTERERDRATHVAEDLKVEDYSRKIDLAHHEIQDDNPGLAESRLFGCPARLRGWEWDFVRRLAHRDLLTYDIHTRAVHGLAVSPDGEWIVSASGITYDDASEDHRAEVKIWDVNSGRERLTLDGDPLVGTIQCVAVSRDGKWIATGGGYYHPRIAARLTLWNATTGKQVCAWQAKGGTVMAVAFHPDGKTLAAGYGRYYGQENATGHIQFIDVEKRVAFGEKLPGPIGGVNGLSYSPDGRRLAVAGYGCTDVWDLATTRSTAVRRSLAGHTKWVFGVAFSPDGQRLTAGGWDRTIVIRDAATLEVITTIDGHRGYVYGLAFSPDGKTIAAAYENRSVKVFEVATGLELAAIHGHTNFVFSVAFHSDGKRIIAGDLDGKVKIWDVQVSQPVVFSRHNGWVSRVGFSEDGKRVVSDSESETCVRESGMAHAGDETRRIWDPSTGQQIGPPTSIARGFSRQFDRGRQFGDGFATSRDGRWKAMADRLNDIKVVEATTGRLSAVLKGHTARVSCLAFSPDGTRIATASGDSTIKLWETGSGREVLTLRGHTAGVLCVAFSPDGKRIISGSIDNTARIWDGSPMPADRAADQEARWLVDALRKEYPIKGELIERFHTDRELSDPVRAAAVAIAEKLEDDWAQVSRVAMNIVFFPRLPREDYVRALRWVDSIGWPAKEEGWHLTLRGVAFFRLGRYPEALTMLERVRPFDTAEYGGDTPIPMAYLAMAHHQLGHNREASSFIEKARESMSKHAWATNVWTRLASDEAEALFQQENAR